LIILAYTCRFITTWSSWLGVVHVSLGIVHLHAHVSHSISSDQVHGFH